MALVSASVPENIKADLKLLAKESNTSLNDYLRSILIRIAENRTVIEETKEFKSNAGVAAVKGVLDLADNLGKQAGRAKNEDAPGPKPKQSSKC